MVSEAASPAFAGLPSSCLSHLIMHESMGGHPVWLLPDRKEPAGGRPGRPILGFAWRGVWPPEPCTSTCARSTRESSRRSSRCALDPPMTLRSGNEGEGEQPPPPGALAAEEPQDRIAVAMGELERSGWYWGSMTVSEAKERLQDAPEGTFLLRDSSHSEYLLTISVKTSAGPTNLRIEYREGKFRLDSVVCIRSRLKQFDSVVQLIEYYVCLSENKKIESETLSNRTVHLWLTKPLYITTPSLQHLCRITVNKSTSKICELPLPTRLKDYLKEYRYHV